MIGAFVRVDALLAWRRGVVVAAVAVAATYVVLLRLLPSDVAGTVLPFLVFSDPAALGYFFVGGTILADRADGTAAAVAVTPSELTGMLAGRVTVLAGLGTLGGAVVAAGSGLAVRWSLFLPVLALTAVTYTCFGYAVAMRSRSVNDYFARSAALSIPLFAPMIAFAVGPAWAGLAAWPTTGSLLLLRVSTGGPGVGAGTSTAALAVLGLAAVLATRWAMTELAAARREGRS